MKYVIKKITAVLILMLILMVTVCVVAQGEKPYTKTTTKCVSTYYIYETEFYNVPVGSMVMLVQYDKDGTLTNVIMREYIGNNEQFMTDIYYVADSYIMIFESGENIKPIMKKEKIDCVPTIIEPADPSISTGGVGQEIFEDNGVLIGIYDNSLNGTDTRLNMSRININENIYELESSINYLDLIDYLGQAVTYKWYTKSGLNYITSIKSANSTTISSIDATLIDGFDGTKLYYYENEDADDTEYYSLDSNLYVVYNGYGVEKASVTTANLTTWLNMDTGSVTLYNNDGDKDIDVIYIEKFETYYAQSPVTSKGVTTIKDQITPTKTVSLDEDDVIVTKVSSAGGSEVAAKLTSISQKNIVSVATPLDPNGKTIVKISSATASGVISTMGENYEDVMIGTKEYKFTDYFRALVASDAAKYGFDMGANVKFYLDYSGRVVYAEVTVSEIPYGYLIDYVTSNDMENEGVTIRFIDASNKLVVYELKSKVRINSVSYDEMDAINILAESAERIETDKVDSYKANAHTGKRVISQLIKYKTGSENGRTVINELFTVGASAFSQADEKGGIIPVWTNTDNSEMMAPFISCINSLTCSGTGTIKQFRANGAFQFAVNSSTVVFKIPNGRTNVAQFSRVTGSGSFTDGYYYYVEAYDIKGTNAKAVVYYMTSVASTTTIAANTSSYIVTGINGVIDDVDKLFVYNKKTVYTKE